MKQFFSKFIPSLQSDTNPIPSTNKSKILPKDEDPARALLERVIGSYADSFDIEYIQQDQNKDVFEIQSLNNRITLRGNNGVSIASALNYYLKNYCYCDITWNGTNLKIPTPLPVVTGTIHITSPYKYRYYLNYCTFCYSMAWWDWERWQQEIDWMALNGINLPLAITGEEAIWQEVYKAMGFTDDDLQSFFSGPAYFGWLFMGNLDGWDGPLPQHWIDSHKDLQKQILARERSLGMTPVLPAFTGHVPPSFPTKYPDAKVTKSSWNGFPDVYILDPSDTMFATIGGSFLKTQTQEYGTDHFYSADTFNENTPPTNDPAYIKQISGEIFNSMTDVDPKAIWVMQGWMFYYDSTYWQAPQIQALLGAVPDNQMLILDLFTEEYPVWKQTEAYYGKPWVWNMLQNFGGRTSMYGRISTVASEPAAALKDPTAQQLMGLGLTPEAIEQNPVIFEMMLENVWSSDPINISQWLSGYAKRRYGIETTNGPILDAWSILQITAYEGGLTRGGVGSMICSRPTFAQDESFVFTELNYEPTQMIQVWRLFTEAAATLSSSEGFRYDLVDVTRQVLANYSNWVQQAFAKAYKDQDTTSFDQYTTEFLNVIDDMDQLLGTHEQFLLGKWINDARKWGLTADEQNLYEKNARNLLTLWGDKDCEIYDYACKQWSGLFKGFYKPRWQQFFDSVKKVPANKWPSDVKDFIDDIKVWEWNWVNSTDGGYSPEPQGNTYVVVADLFLKYYEKLCKIYTLGKEDEDWEVIV